MINASLSSRAALLIPYSGVALALAYLGRHELTPDGFSYIQAARHYAEGSFDLAVNAWWSPLASWLLVPIMDTGIEPVFGFRLLNVIAGMILAAGVGRLAGVLSGTGSSLTGFALGLLLALVMLPRYLTPDMLVSGIVSWYCVLVLDARRSGSRWRAFAAGALGGIAYLAKAYALPFAMVHLIGTFCWRGLRPAGISTRQSLKQLGTALAGFLLFAAPWILVISLHDGKLTISAAARYASAWSREAFGEEVYMPVKWLQPQRPGRIWCWEDPMEFPVDWPTWSPLDGREGLRKQAALIWTNLRTLPEHLNSADRFQLFAPAMVFAIVWNFPFRGHLRGPYHAQRLWACGTVLLYLGGYLVTLMYDRYLWPVWGILAALFAAHPTSSRIAGGQTSEVGTETQLDAARHGALLAILGLSLAINAVAGSYEVWKQSRTTNPMANFVEAAKRLQTGRRYAATSWRPGLLVAYWSKGTFFGQTRSVTPQKLADELAPYAPIVLVIKDRPNIVAELTASGLFRQLAFESPSAQLLEFIPPPTALPKREID